MPQKSVQYYFGLIYTWEDLLNLNLDILTYEEFKLRYKVQTNSLTYYGVINAIPQVFHGFTARASYTMMSELESADTHLYIDV